jgi:hypothetical protein
MDHQLLNGPQIDAGHDQPAGERVPEVVPATQSLWRIGVADALYAFSP